MRIRTLFQQSHVLGQSGRNKAFPTRSPSGGVMELKSDGGDFVRYKNLDFIEYHQSINPASCHSLVVSFPHEALSFIFT